MKLLNFAIASIVDSNTHYLNRGGSLDYNTAVRHGREIRGKSVVSSLKALTQTLRRAYLRYRSRMIEKQEVNRLLHLNDSLLRDIGISREELLSVHFGMKSLAELQAQRTASADTFKPARAQHAQSARVDHTAKAANEVRFTTSKCA